MPCLVTCYLGTVFITDSRLLTNSCIVNVVLTENKLLLYNLFQYVLQHLQANSVVLVHSAAIQFHQDEYYLMTLTVNQLRHATISLVTM